MKLQRLAGYGPIAAFVTAACLFVVAIFQQVAVPAGIFVPAAILFLIVLTGWTGGLAVVLFDLEWLEHPRTSTNWVRAGLIATLVAMVMPVLLALIQFAGLRVPFAIPFSLLFVGVGFSVVVHNIEARRAGLLRGALPWIGIVAGAGYIYLGVLQFIVMFTLALVMGYYTAVIPIQLLYLIWAIWMGVHLIRAKAPRTAAASAASPSAAG